MKYFTMSFLIVVLLLAQPLRADYQLVDHPRMFITKASLPDLAWRCYHDTLIAGDYALMKQEADYFVGRGVLKQPTSEWHPPYELISSGICYLVERELGNDSARVYADAVIKYWGDGLILTNIGNKHFGYYALMYDWIYDAMTPEQRIKCGDYLSVWLRWYTGQPEITLLYGDWLYNQTWGPAHLNIGNTRDGITPKLFVALALSGSGVSREADCKQFLDSFYNRIPPECIPLFDLMGGVWSESYGHGSYGPTRVIPWAFEAWRTATGINLFELGTPTTYLKEINQWVYHLTVPFSNRTAYIDDNDGGELYSSWMPTAPILGARYKDQTANYAAAHYNRGGWSTSWKTLPWQRLLCYDPSVPEKTPGQENWLSARLFTGAGHIYMRSRWDDPNATWAFFGVGPLYAGHSRDDEGNFLIARKGWLVLRAGGEGHNDDDYYAGGSMPFNIVTVYDKNEQYRRTDPGSEALAGGGTKNENDGGLIRRVYTGRTAEGGNRQERGHITAFKHDWRYTYAAADISLGYTRTKINEITRQFFYLRGRREFFVIFDRADSKSAAFPKTWLLHMPAEPSVNGTGTTLTAGHVYSYADADIATWLSDPAGISSVLSSGKSRAFLKTLLPAQRTITKRGGSGYDFWGNSHELNAQYNHYGQASGQIPVVPWRLEIEPAVQATRDYFLHVLEIADENDTQMSDVSLLDQNPDEYGVRIVPRDSEPVEIYFNRTGELSGRVKFAETGLEQLPTEVDTLIQSGGRGDINGDGRLSIMDAVEVLIAVIKNSEHTRYDFNQDGVCSIADVIELLFYVRKSAEYPALAGNTE